VAIFTISDITKIVNKRQTSIRHNVGAIEAPT